MKATVNATPLISLALVNQLDLLYTIFDDVLVPQAVYEEVVVQGSHKPGAKLIVQANWLQIQSPLETLAFEPFLLGLDPGEAAVLLLAQQIQPDWVIIDERQARRVAAALGLPVKGTLGVLLAAAQAQLLPPKDALNSVNRMMERGIRISPYWLQWLENELKRIE